MVCISAELVVPPVSFFWLVFLWAPEDWNLLCVFFCFFLGGSVVFQLYLPELLWLLCDEPASGHGVSISSRSPSQLACTSTGRKQKLEPRASLSLLTRLGVRISHKDTLLEGSLSRDWDSVVPGWVLGISYFKTSVVPMMFILSGKPLLYFTSKDTEAQGGEGSCMSSGSQ